MATGPTQLGTPNVQEALLNLGQNKRAVTIGAIAVTLILTLVIIVFAWSKGTSKGTEIELVKRIDQARAFEIVSKLKSEEIGSKIDDSDLPGKVNVKVFQKEFDKAAITLARSDLLQEEGFNLFDKSDWAASDFDKRVKMARAVNGDLSRIVSRMTGIKWATVRINVPEPQLFSAYEAPPTATVQVELPEEGAKLSRTQVKSVINLLIGYVPNLDRNSISIIDTNGETYSAVETEEIAASELIEETERVNKVIQKRIEGYLEPLLGLNNFIVRVSSEISRKKVEENATTFGQGVIGQEQSGDERLGSGGVTGAQIALGTPSADGKAYLRSNKTLQRYPSFKQKSTSTPPGRISRIAVAIAVNHNLPTGLSLKQLREGIAAITSPNTTSNDVKITVATFARDRKIAHVPVKKETIKEQIQNFVAPVTHIPLWGKIGLGVVGLLIVIGFAGLALKPKATPTKELPKPQEQITQEKRPGLEAPKEEDITGILTGLKEAASYKPEALATKLQIWLEEGTAVR